MLLLQETVRDLERKEPFWIELRRQVVPHGSGPSKGKINAGKDSAGDGQCSSVSFFETEFMKGNADSPASIGGNIVLRRTEAMDRDASHAKHLSKLNFEVRYVHIRRHCTERVPATMLRYGSGGERPRPSCSIRAQ